jgi:hypothetical protein
MTVDPSPTKDDVARLIRGKSSKSRAGSRQIRHRLRQDELRRLIVARERGFLLTTPSTRNTLRNAWHLDCRARERPCVFVERVNAKYLLTGERDSQALREEIPSLIGVVCFVEAL